MQSMLASCKKKELPPDNDRYVTIPLLQGSAVATADTAFDLAQLRALDITWLGNLMPSSCSLPRTGQERAEEPKRDEMVSSVASL